MEAKFFTVKEVTLKNNCPECYSTEGLQLTFKQKFVENAFYRAIATDVKHNMACTTCGTEIFPVRWTEDIERVFDYQQRAFVAKPATFKLKKLTWLLVGVVLVAVIAVGYFFLFKA